MPEGHLREEGPDDGQSAAGVELAEELKCLPQGGPRGERVSEIVQERTPPGVFLGKLQPFQGEVVEVKGRRGPICSWLEDS